MGGGESPRFFAHGRAGKIAALQHAPGAGGRRKKRPPVRGDYRLGNGGKHMGYRYETHLHTKEVSACGHTHARDYIKFYMERGYHGIIFTDHFFNGNCGVPRSLPWEERVDAFCRGYELAKEEGDRNGFAVFFGWEFNFEGDEYLTYGLDKAWLKENPQIMTDTREEYYKRVHEAGGLVVQAHPYRERGYLDAVRLNPYYVDAVEYVNIGNEPYMDELAFGYASAYGLPVTGGTDMHNIEAGQTPSGVETQERLTCIADYVRTVRSGKGFRPIRVLGRAEGAEKEIRLPVLKYERDGRFVRCENRSELTAR